MLLVLVWRDLCQRQGLICRSWFRRVKREDWVIPLITPSFKAKITMSFLVVRLPCLFHKDIKPTEAGLGLSYNFCPQTV